MKLKFRHCGASQGGPCNLFKNEVLESALSGMLEVERCAFQVSAAVSFAWIPLDQWVRALKMALLSSARPMLLHSD